MIKPNLKYFIKNHSKIKHSSRCVLLILVISIFSACNTTKKVGENEYLLTRNQIQFETKEKPLKNSALNYVKQKPNRKLAGIVPIDLTLYNLSPKELDEAFAEYYRIRDGERNQKVLDSILRLYNQEDYLGKSLWLKRLGFKLGKPPVIVDSSLLFKSNENLEAYYFNKGYFDAKVTSEIKPTRKKRAKIVYDVDPGEPAYIETFEYKISDPKLKDIYEINLAGNKIDTGTIFDFDKFKQEESRIGKLFKNNGYFDFNDDGESMIFEADTIEIVDNDTIATPKNLDIKLLIPRPEDSIKFNQYYFDKITVYPDSRPGTISADYYTFEDRDYIYKFVNPPEHDLDYFSNAITIKPLELYRLKDEVSTKRNLFRRENFNFGQLQIEKSEEHSDSLLNANIYLFPKKKYEATLFFEASDSEYLRFGLSPGFSLLRRNIFGGGENLEFSFRSTFATPGNTDVTENQGIFSAFEYGGQLSLTYPYLLLPFNWADNVKLENVNPSSKINLGFSVQNNIGLDRINYLFGLDYNFSSQPQHNHKFTIFNTQIVNNRNANRYFDIVSNDRAIFETGLNIYNDFDPATVMMHSDELISDSEIINIINNDQAFLAQLTTQETEDITNFQNMAFRRESLLQDNFINSFIYQYTYDQKKIENKSNPWFFRGQFELGGNLLSLADSVFGFAKVNENGREVSSILGIPYSQFFKVDLDFRKYWRLNEYSSIAARSFIGLSLPYGNSDIVPIDKSYFAGGATDIRAWPAYDLGPGSVNSLSNFNISNFKLTWNLEYRFKMFSILEGALFTDAGNIWSIKNGSNIGPFEFGNFWNEIAVGSGFGFRFDFTYLIARLDLAYKIHDPGLAEGQRWIFEPLSPRFNLGINYPF